MLTEGQCCRFTLTQTLQSSVVKSLLVGFKAQPQDLDFVLQIYLKQKLISQPHPPYLVRDAINILLEPLKYIACSSPCIFICLTHANVWESIGKPCSCTHFVKSRIFFTTSHVHASEHATKSKVRMIKSLSTQYQAIPEKISLVCCRWHCYSCCILITIQTATNS